MNKLIRRMSLILALIIPFNLAGCKDGQKNVSDEANTGIEEFNEPTEEELAVFLAEMAEIMPVYNLYDIYLNEEEMGKLMGATESIKECTNTELDGDSLYDSIVSNSLGRGLIANPDEEVSEDDKVNDEIVRTSLKTVLDNMISRGDISLEDACVLQDLKIVRGLPDDGSLMKYENGDNTLIINYDAFCKIYSNIANEDLKVRIIKEAFIRWLEMGINKCRLVACKCRLEAGQINQTITYGNTLHSLESMAISDGDNGSLGEINKAIFDNLTLTNNRNVSVLLLLAVFKENRNIDDLNQALFNTDLQGVNDFFGAFDEKEIERFYKISTTLDIVTEENSYKENFYNSTGSTNEIDYRNHIGYAYKTDIFKTALSDLMRHFMYNRDITKEESVYLYRFLKSVILNNTNTGEVNDTYTFDVGFMKDILEEEEIFFGFLRALYGISDEELQELYNCGISIGGSSDSIDYEKLAAKFPLMQFIIDNYDFNYGYMQDFDLEAGESR